jgi:hypothetical protein
MQSPFRREHDGIKPTYLFDLLLPVLCSCYNGITPSKYGYVLDCTKS